MEGLPLKKNVLQMLIRRAVESAKEEGRLERETGPSIGHRQSGKTEGIMECISVILWE